MAYDISPERREEYRQTSIRSQQRKRNLLRTSLGAVRTYIPRLDPSTLMPKLASNHLGALSLFSGGGGLDVGFEHAGFEHLASYDVLEICGSTLRRNRPRWNVNSGEDGDVTGVDWKRYRGAVDVLHGGPPCQPFSIAGKRMGAKDSRNMWPAYVAAVLAMKPRVFIAENVTGLMDRAFGSFVDENILKPLQTKYVICTFRLSADEFGVPQGRKRVFMVGFINKQDAARFTAPNPTHSVLANRTQAIRPPNKARFALGLNNIGFDALAPTLRSGFTGPRNTTGVLNSKASLLIWNKLKIWPNGVQPTRDLAARFKPENGHYRLSVAECALLQGFPLDWSFEGPVYQALGQIGNSVCPPVAYWVGRAVSSALSE